MKSFLIIFWNAAVRLVYEGSLSHAGNVALSLMLSLFPFMIFTAAFLNFWGSPELLENILTIVFSHWPAGSAGPIAEQLNIVLGQASGELFTIGNAIALILATNGIESARDALNRAYGFSETRNFLLRRLQGVIFVTFGALLLMAAAVILIGTPVVWQLLLVRLPWLSEFGVTVGLVQYGIAISLLGVVLFSIHYFLPAGRHKSGDVLWGMLLTIAGIIIGSQLFAYYLTNFANYRSLYAGLAGTMIVIVFLYFLSVLILFGAEFNASLRRFREGKTEAETIAEHDAASSN